MRDWQSIDTAPRDGTNIMAFFPECDGLVAPAYWGTRSSEMECHFLAWGRLTPKNPTHWMPFPAPPKP